MPTYQPASLPYQGFQPPPAQYNQGRASTTSDPRKIASNELQQVQGQGDVLQSNALNLANQYGQQAAGVEDYLNPVENTLAQGGGGYNTSEQAQIQLDPATKSQITLSPQDKQNIITGAGISAGAGTASAVGAADRAAAASGGNPAAMATYRARAAQTQGAQAGDAMTQARIGAKQAESQGAQAAQNLQSQGAQTVGNARMGQQNQALGYYGGLQQEKAGQSLAEQGLQNQAYGTETSGTGNAAKIGLEASQTPSTFDKVIGGVAGAVSHLADGSTGDGIDAVLGEDGPEVIVEHSADPVRSHTQFMAEGGDPGYDPEIDARYETGGSSAPVAPAASAQPSIGLFQRFKNYLGSQHSAQQDPAQSGAAQQPVWNKTTPYKEMGNAIGTGAAMLMHLADGRQSSAPHMADGSAPWWGGLATDVGKGLISQVLPLPGLADGSPGTYRAHPHMADGGMADGLPSAPKFNPGKLITSPTRVHLDPGDQVVPLSYRAKAKIRPSAALSTLSPVRLDPRLHHVYGGPRG